MNYHFVSDVIAGGVLGGIVAITPRIWRGCKYRNSMLRIDFPVTHSRIAASVHICGCKIAACYRLHSFDRDG